MSKFTKIFLDNWEIFFLNLELLQSLKKNKKKSKINKIIERINYDNGFNLF